MSNNINFLQVIDDFELNNKNLDSENEKIVLEVVKIFENYFNKTNHKTALKWNIEYEKEFDYALVYGIVKKIDNNEKYYRELLFKQKTLLTDKNNYGRYRNLVKTTIKQKVGKDIKEIKKELLKLKII